MVYELSSNSLEMINEFADEAEERINKMVADQWATTLANPKHDAYLGNSIKTGVNRALDQSGMPTLTVARSVELDPAIDQYLDARGGQFITWLTDSGKNDFRNLMMKAYREKGTLSGFTKMFREQYPAMQPWKAKQIWITESNLAATNAQFSAYEQIPDVIGFRNILGNNPCPICRYQASYDHKINEERGPYHVYCVCIPEPIIAGIHKFSTKKSDPLKFMDKNVYDRLNNSYKEFNKGSILKIDLGTILS